MPDEHRDPPREERDEHVALPLDPDGIEGAAEGEPHDENESADAKMRNLKGLRTRAVWAERAAIPTTENESADAKMRKLKGLRTRADWGERAAIPTTEKDTPAE